MKNTNGLIKPKLDDRQVCDEVYFFMIENDRAL